MAAISRARDLTIQAPEEVVFLYMNEHTANLPPRVGRAYHPVGQPGQQATGAGSELIRLAGAWDVATGQVICRGGQSFPVKEVYRFLYHVEQHYPCAKVMYIALDNWPNHFHGSVRDPLAGIPSLIRWLPLPT